MQDVTESVLVKKRCGHSQKMPIWGSGEGRDKWLAKLEASDCKVCWLKSKATKFLVLASRVEVSNGYPIRDLLKDRGYRFQARMWRKRFGSPKEAAAELDWIVASGYPVSDER